jgi:deoxycytidine triphosphate deaminase
MIDFRGPVCVIPPNSFALARTIEYFRIPRKVLTVCLGKSTYARCGIIVNVTPFEPEWEGFVTLEISNTTPLPARIYANEGIAQVLFFEADENARSPPPIRRANTRSRKPYCPSCDSAEIDRARFGSIGIRQILRSNETPVPKIRLDFLI